MAMQSLMLAMGYGGQEKLACAIRVEMKHLERSYSTLCCSISDILSFVTPPPPPLRSQAFAAMQSIMLAMGSGGQEKLACAIRIEMKHLERSYSTLSCSISDILSFVTPLPCVYKKL